jgi:hypothetical protein
VNWASTGHPPVLVTVKPGAILVHQRQYPKNSTQKLLDIINSYSKVAGYKINIEKSLAFYTLIMSKLKKNI